MEHTESDILKMDLEEAYHLFLIEKKNMESSDDTDSEETKETKEVYKKARFGIRVRFDIHDYFNEIYTHKAKCAKVKIGGETYDREDFYTETEERETLIKNFLIGLIDNNNPVAENRAKW